MLQWLNDWSVSVVIRVCLWPNDNCRVLLLVSIAEAVYANVAPKLPQHLLRRAKSFTLNTTHSVQEAWPPESPSPTSAQPPSNRRVELHTCGGGGGGSESPQDEKETGPYTPICYDTLDKGKTVDPSASEQRTGWAKAYPSNL